MNIDRVSIRTIIFKKNSTRKLRPVLVIVLSINRYSGTRNRRNKSIYRSGETKVCYNDKLYRNRQFCEEFPTAIALDGKFVAPVQLNYGLNVQFNVDL